MPQERGKRKEKIGVVLGNKMDKTIVVKVERFRAHLLYGRILKKASKFKVHDEENTAKIGDKVRIVQIRPLSKDKHWRLVEILK